MIDIDPQQIPTRDLHQFILGTVAPRPIAFVSTIDEKGRPNLAPYSFFNAFSSNPPIVVFSSNRRVTNNTTKDTLYNVRATGEVVINMVNFDIVRQMAVCSVEFPQGISEFEQSGLTPIPSQVVRPPRVKESPAHLECKVRDIITLGTHGGAGHLIICEVVRLHIAKEVVDERGRIDPHKIDLMGRLGRAYYVRASGDAVYTIVQPVTKMVIGYQSLPEHVRHSHVLTGNHIGLLAGLHKRPSPQEVLKLMKEDPHIQQILSKKENPIEALHRYAAQLLDQPQPLREKAGQVVWIPEYLTPSS